MTQFNPNNVQYLTLGDAPFHHWLESIKECLTAMDCEEYIDTNFNFNPTNGLTKKQKQDINRCLNLIKSSVKHKDRETIFNCTTPLAMIDKLKNKYRSSKTSNIFDLMRQYQKIKFDGDVSKLFSEVRRNVIQMAEKELRMPDSFIVAKVIDVLPSEYRDICTQVELLNIKEDSSISSDTFESMLLRRERELGEPEKELSGATLISSKKNVAMKCNFCGLKNHVEKDCRRKNRNKPANSKRHSNFQSYRKQNEKSDNDDKNHLDPATTLVSAMTLIASNSNNNKSPKFLADSAASFHIVNDVNLLSNQRHTDRTITSLKQSTKVHIIGDLHCEFFNGTKWTPGKISDVSYVPNQPFNLISTGQLCRKGAKVNTNEYGMIVYRMGKPIIVADWSKDYENLFDMKIRVKQNIVASAASSLNSMAIWHERCAHFSTATISKMINKHLVDGVPNKIDDNMSFCVSCKAGKMTATNHPKNQNHQYLKPGVKLHLDIGGYTSRSIHGNKYYLVAVDEISGFIKIAFMKNRQETLEKFRKIVTEVKLDTGNDVLCIRTDHGTEFLSNDFKSFINNRGIIHELATVKTPQQNGRVERAIRNIVDHSISMLSSSNLPLSLWDESTNSSVYIINRMLNSNNIIPFEKYFGRRVNLSNLRIFGCTGYALIKNDRHKYSSKTKKVFMVGYHSSNTYRVYCPQNRRVEFACDVKFNEQAKCHASPSKTNVNESIIIDNNDNNKNASFTSIESFNSYKFDANITNSDSTIDNVNGGSDVDYNTNTQIRGSDENLNDIDIDENIVNDENFVINENIAINETVNQRPNIGRPLGSTNRQYELNIDKIKSLRPRDVDGKAIIAVAGSEPITFREAINSSDSFKWKQAMQHEFDQLLKNQTWKLVDPPSNSRIISVKWVYTIKEDGRYRARLVARGFEQDDKSSYDCYAPVVCMESIRLFFSIIASFNMSLIQFDVSCAFLNGHITGNVYIRQPPGYEDDSGRVCKLARGLYGLRESPKSWNSMFDQTVRSFGFKPTNLDPCFYFIRENNVFTIMIIYVDDGIIASTDKNKPNEIYNKLSNKFEIRKVNSSRFLGIEYERNYRNRTIILKQQQYLIDKLKTFNMDETRKSDSPFACGLNPYDTESPPNENYPYRQAIGALLYLSCKTRPDIAYSVSLLARFTNDPREIHVRAVKRLFRYLNGTRSNGIIVGGNSQKHIIGYSDADLAGDKINGRTTTGHFVYYGGPILWKTHLQRCTIDNTCEAEYIAASLCSKDIKYIRNLLIELGIETEIPVLNCDNRSTVYQLYHESISPKLRHISIKYHSIRNDINDKNIIIKWISTENQIADILTKNPPPGRFNSLLILMNRGEVLNIDS